MTRRALIAAGLVLSAVCRALPADPVDDVLWLDDAHTRLLFVSGERLRAAGSWEGSEVPSLTTIGFSERETEMLAEAIQWFREPGRMPVEKSIAGDCPSISMAVTSSSAPDGSGDRKFLGEWLHALGGPAYIARVTHLVPGWSPAYFRVMTQIRLEVETRLQGFPTELSASVPTLLRGFGWMVLGSTTLCHTSGGDLESTRIGDRFFVWEMPGETKQPLTEVRVLLPVSLEGIDISACPYCRDVRRLPVETLQKSLLPEGAGAPR